MTTIPPVKQPTFWSGLASGVETWGLAHWSYILVAVGANLVGVIFHF